MQCPFGLTKAAPAAGAGVHAHLQHHEGGVAQGHLLRGAHSLLCGLLGATLRWACPGGGVGALEADATGRHPSLLTERAAGAAAMQPRQVGSAQHCTACPAARARSMCRVCYAAGVLCTSWSASCLQHLGKSSERPPQMQPEAVSDTCVAAGLEHCRLRARPGLGQRRRGRRTHQQPHQGPAAGAPRSCGQWTCSSLCTADPFAAMLCCSSQLLADQPCLCLPRTSTRWEGVALLSHFPCCSSWTAPRCTRYVRSTSRSGRRWQPSSTSTAWTSRASSMAAA